jgi:predicted phosphohydrolase
MEEQQNLVNKLKGDLQKAKDKVYSMEQDLEDEIMVLQSLCNLHGHQYVAESNHDYHKPGYYYVCENCQYCSLYKPEKFTYKKVSNY